MGDHSADRSGSPEPLAGLPGRVGEQLGLCLGFQKQRTLGVTFRGGQEAGAPTQLRVWWVTGESPEESCMFRKHTQWEGQGKLDRLDLQVQAPCRMGT